MRCILLGLAVLCLTPSSIAAAQSPVNASFTDTTIGWTASVGTTISRDSFNDTPPASGLWESHAGPVYEGDTLTGRFEGTFCGGQEYALSLRAASGAILPYFPGGVDLTFGVPGDTHTATPMFHNFAWHTFRVSWTPTANRSGVVLIMRPTVGIGGINVDTLTLSPPPYLSTRCRLVSPSNLPTASQ